mmetsp:Transcript_52574/g.123329  ORF Transcript_52574/g.123329 Transcript_52574/m.123329 type:complete len:580 (-) Transcript_52574:1044-2783(-)
MMLLCPFCAATLSSVFPAPSLRSTGHPASNIFTTSSFFPCLTLEKMLFHVIASSPAAICWISSLDNPTPSSLSLLFGLLELFFSRLGDSPGSGDMGGSGDIGGSSSIGESACFLGFLGSSSSSRDARGLFAYGLPPSAMPGMLGGCVASSSSSCRARSLLMSDGGSTPSLPSSPNCTPPGEPRPAPPRGLRSSAAFSARIRSFSSIRFRRSARTMSRRSTSVIPSVPCSSPSSPGSPPRAPSGEPPDSGDCMPSPACWNALIGDASPLDTVLIGDTLPSLPLMGEDAAGGSSSSMPGSCEYTVCLIVVLMICSMLSMSGSSESASSLPYRRWRVDSIVWMRDSRCCLFFAFFGSRLSYASTGFLSSIPDSAILFFSSAARDASSTPSAISTASLSDTTTPVCRWARSSSSSLVRRYAGVASSAPAVANLTFLSLVGGPPLPGTVEVLEIGTLLPTIPRRRSINVSATSSKGDCTPMSSTALSKGFETGASGASRARRIVPELISYVTIVIGDPGTAMRTAMASSGILSSFASLMRCVSANSTRDFSSTNDTSNFICRMSGAASPISSGSPPEDAVLISR